MLTDVTIFWLTKTIALSIRMYRAVENIPEAEFARTIEVPTGYAHFPPTSKPRRLMPGLRGLPPNSPISAGPTTAVTSPHWKTRSFRCGGARSRRRDVAGDGRAGGGAPVVAAVASGSAGEPAARRRLAGFVDAGRRVPGGACAGAVHEDAGGAALPWVRRAWHRRRRLRAARAHGLVHHVWILREHVTKRHLRSRGGSGGS
jgi:hypothetical protein